MQFQQLKRREFITLLGGAAGWPLVARAQQVDPLRRIGVLMAYNENDAEAKAYLSGFTQGLQELGWTEGRNVRMDVRWAADNVDRIRMRTFAKELVALQPDVILAFTTPVTATLQRETRAIPIVFAVVDDPVGVGFVASLSHPGGNMTGFINAEASIGGKWLGLIKEIAPDIKRAAIMFNPDTAPGGGSYHLGSFEAAARSLAVEPITARVGSDADIEAAISSLGRDRAGLVLTGDSFLAVHQQTIISLAARNNVPAIFNNPPFARNGGLISYGPSFTDIFRRAAGHVDRILRGTKASDLPVEVPTKFDLVINLKTAKALGLTVPNTLLVSADEVIE
jgi:putative tryptophan/tyrosine transport system substrate-binding protein